MILLNMMLWICSGIALIICISVGILRFCLLTIIVKGESMSPTFQHMDRVLAWRVWPTFWLRRGWIVLIQSEANLQITPDETPNLCIKRIMALPGETFIARPTMMPDAINRQATQKIHEEEQTWQIPPGHIFVCGDNYRQSIDSRIWGPLPLRNVRGIILFPNHSQSHRQPALRSPEKENK